MSMKLSKEFSAPFYTDAEYEALVPEAKKALETVKENYAKGVSPLGWYTLPSDYDKEEFARIQAAAERIKKDSDILIVIGIGGSY